MPPKRTRRSSPVSSGLGAGERLKRARLANNAEYTAWGWVGTEVMDLSDVTLEHCQSTCGFSNRALHPVCKNKFSVSATKGVSEGRDLVADVEENGDDVIIISDDDTPTCSNKNCKGNPYCLNYLGQHKWEDEEKARKAFMKCVDLGEPPVEYARTPGIPVGLKNLGATCYANAYLQVWFQDLPFRRGVYQCQPSHDKEHNFEESPIFQLQVTFAAMQNGAEAAFNPVKLVESLKLRTTEQQDAQEFSKLFMAHLDTEFQKQSDPVLKSLIADQFQGKQAYCTVCARCHQVSERESDFLEVEVNIKNGSTLQDCIETLLQPELLTGDNKYFCQRCENLEDAKRYTELRELPPVLHFSLLRFVYDLQTMERKKSKSSIKFPVVIDMDRFMGPAEKRASSKIKVAKSQNVYALRGILLHKGSSAYHGHYEAQVLETQKRSWYQFNDERVTEIKSLFPKLDGKRKDAAPVETGTKRKDVPFVKTKDDNASKKRKTDSGSDIEIIEQDAPSLEVTETSITSGRYIESRDAYMLVYSRVDNVANTSPTGDAPDASDKSPRDLMEIPEPPRRALDVVNRLNAGHREACEAFSEREHETRARFDELRRMVMEIYRTWQLSSRDEEGVVVSRQALESWLSRHLTSPSKQQASDSKAESTEKSRDASSEHASGRQFIAISEVLCPHGKLDAEKATDMKLITKHACNRMADDDGYVLEPELTQKDVCQACVVEGFSERLYEMEHPRAVARFDEISPSDDLEEGYWVSKPWLKDWRLVKPRMHVRGQHDPSPDADEFKYHVRCEHGGLATNLGVRRRISAEAYVFLQNLFPSWQPPSTDTELCPVCEAYVHISKEDKREIRKRAEEEKANLKHMYDNSLSGHTALSEDVPCAIVPADFVRAWRQWATRPAEVDRPAAADNSQFVCEHGMLCIDPNLASDLDSSVSIIIRRDWEYLTKIYSVGPLIAIEGAGGIIEHDLPVCQECRRKRRSAYEMTEVTIRVLGPKDPIPTPQTYNPETVQVHASRQPHTLLTYGSRKAGGLRQSNRIRQSKDRGRRQKVTITQDMTVKRLKLLIQEELKIPIILQRLFHQGHELDDSTRTVKSLGVLSNDLLDLREEGEDIDLLSGSDDGCASGKRKEGAGFGGTVLGGMIDTDSDDAPAPSSIHEDSVGKACPACTYENGADALACAMCETPLA